MTKDAAPGHTPGEWKHHRPTGAVKSGDTLIASVFGDRDDCHEDERQIANARLISAAPDLLEALRELLGVCPCRNGCEPSDMTCASNKARAAIAKATGQEG